MNCKGRLTTAGVTVLLAAVGAGAAIAAQDKYTLKVPNGLAFSEFKGYEDWTTVAVSQTGSLIVVILANPVMIDAYRAGARGNGKRFPDGSRMAKIHWNAKKSAEAPAPTTVPGTLHDIDLMVRDSKRFPDTGNWGYAQFNYAPRVRHIHTPGQWDRLRARVPYNSGGERLRFHGVRQEVR